MQPDATLANPTILKGLVAAPRAWHGPDLVEDDFKILLTGDCIAELETIIAEQRKAPVPTLVLQPEHFKMDACRKLMQAGRLRPTMRACCARAGWSKSTGHRAFGPVAALGLSAGRRMVKSAVLGRA